MELSREKGRRRETSAVAVEKNRTLRSFSDPFPLLLSSTLTLPRSRPPRPPHSSPPGILKQKPIYKKNYRRLDRQPPGREDHDGALCRRRPPHGRKLPPALHRRVPPEGRPARGLQGLAVPPRHPRVHGPGRGLRQGRRDGLDVDLRVKIRRRALCREAHRPRPAVLGKADWLDGKHVVFGRVLGDSLLVVRKVEAVATSGAGNRPSLPVVITECGEM